MSVDTYGIKNKPGIPRPISFGSIYLSVISYQALDV